MTTQKPLNFNNMTTITQEMIANAESFILRWRSVTTELVRVDSNLYDTYTSGMFPAEKKGKKKKNKTGEVE